MKPNIGQGDNGTTNLLGGGKKVPKDSSQVEAYGALDELVSLLGYINASTTKVGSDPTLVVLLEKIQDHLFRIASHISAAPEAPRSYLPYIDSKHIAFLESVIEKYEKDLPELQNFILPGGTELAALFHVARTEARRAERRLVEASREITLHPQAIPYVNRLSDVFFTLSRWANYTEDVEETKWVGLGKKGI